MRWTWSVCQSMAGAGVGSTCASAGRPPRASAVTTTNSRVQPRRRGLDVDPMCHLLLRETSRLPGCDAGLGERWMATVEDSIGPVQRLPHERGRGGAAGGVRDHHHPCDQGGTQHELIGADGSWRARANEGTTMPVREPPAFAPAARGRRSRDAAGTRPASSSRARRPGRRPPGPSAHGGTPASPRGHQRRTPRASCPPPDVHPRQWPCARGPQSRSPWMRPGPPAVAHRHHSKLAGPSDGLPPGLRYRCPPRGMTARCPRTQRCRANGAGATRKKWVMGGRAARRHSSPPITRAGGPCPEHGPRRRGQSPTPWSRRRGLRAASDGA